MVCMVEAGCGCTVVVVNNENRWICGVDCRAEVGELWFGGMKTAVRGVVLSDGCCVCVVSFKRLIEGFSKSRYSYG